LASLIDSARSPLGRRVSEDGPLEKERPLETSRRKETRLYSIAALQKERGLDGRFDVGGVSYRFGYIPARAEVVNGKLNLVGEFSVVDPRGQKRGRKDVRLVLRATQGGLGNLPTLRIDLPASAQAAARRHNQTSPTSPATAGAGDRPLPYTESTGQLSFVGVMYLSFEPLSGAEFGVPADMSRVQLNARLLPADGTEETLQYLYSQITDSLYSGSPDLASANVFVKDLNQVLSRQS